MILLDTHAWVWWIDGSGALSETAREAIEHAVVEDRALVSAISAWEVALLVKRGRLELAVPSTQWIGHCASLEFLDFVPVDREVAQRSVALPDHHRDPADRIILATALGRDVPVVSKDRRFTDYEGVDVIW